MYKRIIIKLSGEALANKNNNNKFDDEIINNIARQIKNIMSNNIQIGIVVGGGNFWRGRSADSNMDKVKADQIGMLATVMNALYLADNFRQNNIKTKVMTPFVIGSMTKLFSKESAIKNMNNNHVLIFAGGTGHPFFSTDTITALRAAELEADCIFYAKNIDGIYDSDPKINSNARKYKKISYEKIIKDNLNAIDIAAMNISKNIASVVFLLDKNNSLETVVLDNKKVYDIGTLVLNNITEEFY